MAALSVQGGTWRDDGAMHAEGALEGEHGGRERREGGARARARKEEGGNRDLENRGARRGKRKEGRGERGEERGQKEERE